MKMDGTHDMISIPEASDRSVFRVELLDLLKLRYESGVPSLDAGVAS